MKNTRNSPSCNVSPKGFTLIELLTVIAIIGILAAILIPVVGAVRESARVGACASQLRDLGLAVHLYAEDNGERTPPNTHLGEPHTVSGTLGGRVISLLLHPDKGGLVNAGDYLDSPHQLYCPYTREDLFTEETEYKRPETVDKNNKIGRTGYFWMYFTSKPYTPDNLKRLNDRVTVENPNRPFVFDFPKPGTAGLGPKFTYNAHEKRANVWHIGGHVTSVDLDELTNASDQNAMFDYMTFQDWSYTPDL